MTSADHANTRLALKVSFGSRAPRGHSARIENDSRGQPSHLYPATHPAHIICWAGCGMLVQFLNNVANYQRLTPRGGGAGGIRTLDTLLTYTHFPGERLRPLGHRSALLWNAPARAGLAAAQAIACGAALGQSHSDDHRPSRRRSRPSHAGADTAAVRSGRGGLGRGAR